jgi:hypothetical protein
MKMPNCVKGLRLIVVSLGLSLYHASSAQQSVRVERMLDAPIIGPWLHPSIGDNIQGPSLIRVPAWVESPLGRYYLYFADHKGRYIRLAYADAITGPRHIHAPGSLQIEDSFFLTDPPELSDEQAAEIRAEYERSGVRWSHDAITEAITPHIASPDVYVDDPNRRILMYFHGLDAISTQVTRVAVSHNGIDCVTRPERLGLTYMRRFDWNGRVYAMSMPGQFYRSADGLSGFEAGPRLFNTDMRHAALLVRGSTLYVFWTRVGDVPEHIKLSTIDLDRDWMQWRESAAFEVLRPERDWEGAGEPLEPSVRSTAYEHVNQLRDPAIFEEDGRVFLLYAVAGEAGIALAEVFFDD